MRHDAMLGAAESIMEIERLARSFGNSLFCTVGYIACRPNLANCIAGEVDLRLDVRSDTRERLDSAAEQMLAAVQNVCTRRELTVETDQFFASPLIPCTEGLLERVEKAITAVQGNCLRLPSGAGHDAAQMGQVWPMAMFFVRCEKGLSHCPQENIRLEDADAAVNVLERLLSTY